MVNVAGTPNVICLPFIFITLALFWQDAKLVCPPGWYAWQHNEVLKCLAAASEHKQVEINSSADRKEQSTNSFMPELLHLKAGYWGFIAKSKQPMCNLCPSVDPYQHCETHLCPGSQHKLIQTQIPCIFSWQINGFKADKRRGVFWLELWTCNCRL